MIAPIEGYLPNWFIDKWKHRVDFGGDYWTSKGEFKYWGDFLYDVHVAYKELNKDDQSPLPWQLIEFADEGHIAGPYQIDVQHHWIDEDGVKTRRGIFEDNI